MSLSGLTRSRVQADHALLTPESHVPCMLPGWRDATLTILVSPRIGAGFTQFYVDLLAGGATAPPQDGIQRFVYVMEGELDADVGDGKRRVGAGAYIYTPAGHAHTLEACAPTRLLVFEKPWVPLGDSVPEPVLAHERDVVAEPFLGDPDAMLKTFLPVDDRYDMAINHFTFVPGATLPMVEVHVMEHGLTLLSGAGVYRLGDSWYTVQKGDSIWMAPYLPQWFCATGKTPTSYIYYKDMNRDVYAAGQR
ncbi:MAG: (S)-ureidoglycine aminohydrolase [Deltaproteobacteria bacterium]|nr:(S)-ureidoglycine aminohydrolase [Deltaproteobacteria bacterium]MCB9788481.1 (S)-ureidoglycine aminohydrolase [Deltaproteobacteria bacterium]